MSDRLTDHATPPVTIGCVYIHGNPMQPNSMYMCTQVYLKNGH